MRFGEIQPRSSIRSNCVVSAGHPIPTFPLQGRRGDRLTPTSLCSPREHGELMENLGLSKECNG